MTIIILPNSKTFAGITYNEAKNELGVSELLAAENFGFSGGAFKKADYINYMEYVCKTNGRVGNVQFHAVVSAKGRENTFEELRDVAVKYLETMGYGKNPYLIYGHSDTKNNHVHLVTTRVDKQGNKIDDRFEKLRTQRFIKEVLGQDFSSKVDDVVTRALEYNFSNRHQFKMLIESMGWKVQEKPDYMEVIKGGYVQNRVSNEVVDAKVSQYQVDEQRKRQLSALLHKYKTGLTYLELQTLMRKKFGVEMIFHTGKGHTKPYGFTAIDHSKRSVYKGGQLIDLKLLLTSPERQEKVDECRSLIDLTSSNDHSIESFKKELSSYDYKFYLNGDVSIKGESQPLLRIDDATLKRLRYNTRLGKARHFNLHTHNEASIIAKTFFVKSEDLVVSGEKLQNNELNFYGDMMRSYLGNDLDIAQKVKDKELIFAQKGGVLYLVDPLKSVIASSEELGVEFSKDSQSISILEVDSLGSNSKVEYNFELSGLLSFIDVLDQNYTVAEDQKRRKKQKRTNN